MFLHREHALPDGQALDHPASCAVEWFAAPITLVGSQPQSVTEVCTYIQEAVGQALPTASFTTVGPLADRGRAEILVLLANGPEDAEPVQRLVQEVCLQKLPVRVILLEQE